MASNDTYSFDQFLREDTRTLSRRFRARDSAHWQKQGEQRALRLFHKAATYVPAYRDFLKKNRISAQKIRTLGDFQHIPPVDKKTYLSVYPLKDLVFPDTIQRLHTFSASSGSTGAPFLWPRGNAQEAEGALLHELVIREIFGITPRTPALCVVAFSMGTWIAGTYTLASMRAVSTKGYQFMTITPGIDQQTLFDVLARLLPDFKTVVLAGYPPYIKDIIDEGRRRGIRWGSHHMKFILAGEAVSESLRAYIVRNGGGRDVLFDAVSLYGTADAAILAHETPLSIFIRRSAAHHHALGTALFGSHHLPSLFQYHPTMRFFESLGGELVFTAHAGIPLIRYRIGDTGGIMSYEEFRSRLLNFTPSLLAGFRQRTFLWKLPFVYLFGRTDLAASFYAILIYPEHIKAGLESHALASVLTGKFVMSAEYRNTHQQYLSIRVELRPGVRATVALKKRVEEKLLAGLLRHNIEYRKLYQSMGKRVLPVVYLTGHGDSKYFSLHSKQRWVRR